MWLKGAAVFRGVVRRGILVAGPSLPVSGFSSDKPDETCSVDSKREWKSKADQDSVTPQTRCFRGARSSDVLRSCNDVMSIVVHPLANK